MKMFAARIADGHRVRPGHGKPGEILKISFQGLRENYVLLVIRKSLITQALIYLRCRQIQD